jgi:NadR type nicotinamide-nucleotide adenylyltransferase
MDHRLWSMDNYLIMIKKIVAIGPESTGKSTLCKQLAEHFHTIWCLEYAREYLNQNGVKYGYDDLLKIAQGQLVIEDYCMEKLQAASYKEQSSQLAARGSQLLFVDTNMYVMKVWYEYVFGKCEHLVLDEISKRHYDLYLLCNIDLPWTPEEMREYPDKQPRTELYNMYKDILLNQTTTWVEISGSYEERLATAIEAVKKYCL